MSTRLVSPSLGSLLIFMLASAAFAQPQQRPAPAPPPPAAPASPSEPKQPTQAQLEEQFTTALNKAVFQGRWCVVKDGKLGPEKEERYLIQGVKKLGGDVWMIHARLQYGGRDVTVPIPVQVKWAGDTAVISLTKLAIPNVGTYTARVVIYDGLYAGTWSGGDHGGLLSGTINKQE